MTLVCAYARPGLQLVSLRQVNKKSSNENNNLPAAFLHPSHGIPKRPSEPWASRKANWQMEEDAQEDDDLDTFL